MKDISFDVNRRSLIKSAAGFSLGAIALNSLNAADKQPARNENGGIEGLPHFKAKAKRVIYGECSAPLARLQRARRIMKRAC